jgi:phosphoribosylglycinamide formyltransferase-1
MSPLRVGVLASGAGTNLQALLDSVHGEDGIEIVAVASNNADALALDRARRAGVAAAVFELGDFADREARDAAIAAWLASHDVGLVVLAGYMQLLTPGFIAAFAQRIVNVHPALLPAFPGIRAIEQALEHGVRVAGVTVHFVDDGVDTGPIILQRAIDLPRGADPGTVRTLLQPIEHELLPEAVRLYARGALSFDPENPRRVLIA